MSSLHTATRLGFGAACRSLEQGPYGILAAPRRGAGSVADHDLGTALEVLEAFRAALRAGNYTYAEALPP